MSDFKNVLAFLSGLPSDADVLNAAICMARKFKSHVDAICIMPEPQQIIAAASAGGGLPVTFGEFVESEERRVAEREALARRTFDAVAGGLPAVAKASADEKLTVNFRSIRGRVDEAAVREGLYADLSVSARPADVEDARHAQIAETLLFKTGRPVLLVPPTGTTIDSFSRIMVGWSETAQTIRAIQEAMPLLAHAKSVDVAGVGDDQNPKDIVERLRSRKIPANAISVKASDEDTANALLRLIDDRDVELFVMGGYGHSRMREFILGGVTKTMLRECEIPMFVCH